MTPKSPLGALRMVFKTLRKRIGDNTNSQPLQGFGVEKKIGVIPVTNI